MKTKGTLYLLLIITALLYSCDGSKETTEQNVRLKGQLINLGGNEVRMIYNGASSMVGNSRDVILETDDQGYFDTTLVIEEPAYYNISRNTLYLSPGDDITVHITSSNTEAEFIGTGAAVNNYMKHRLFPKGGSYLEAGRNIKGDFLTTKNTIDSLADIRLYELDTLTDASAEFKRLETARVKADIVNSYFMYPTYASSVKQRANIDFELPARDTLLNMMAPHVKPLLEDINDPDFLDIAVVRDVFSYSNDSLYNAIFFSDLTLPDRTEELLASAKEVRKLTGEITPETANELTAYTGGLSNRDFANEIEYKLDQAKRLFAGQPAIDFSITDTDGNTMMLSDLKGKVLYIDLWATWCGPCLQEAPHYEALAEKFSDDDEVLFVPISTDRTTDVWHEYLAKNEKSLKQYHTVDTQLVEGWSLIFIPRFLLIDKDFNIVSAYAPRPSEEGTEELLRSLL